MKITMTFNMPDDASEHTLAMKASDLYLCLWDTTQEVFRPARNHGYSDAAITKCLEQCGEHGEELVGLLEGKFHEILSERGVNLDELGN